MLWDLLQLLFAGLEEAHGWLSRDWEKRPGLHNRSEENGHKTLLRLLLIETQNQNDAFKDLE